MQRVTIDGAGSGVKEFIRSLPLQAGGVELELEGRVICNVVPPSSELSEAEKAILLQRGRQLVRRSRQRNSGVPERVIEEDVARAVDEVRQQRAIIRAILDTNVLVQAVIEPPRCRSRRKSFPLGLLELHLELQVTQQLPHVVIGLGRVEAGKVPAELHQRRVQEQVLLSFRKARGPDH